MAASSTPAVVRWSTFSESSTSATMYSGFARLMSPCFCRNDRIVNAVRMVFASACCGLIDRRPINTTVDACASRTLSSSLSFVGSPLTQMKSGGTSSGRSPGPNSTTGPSSLRRSASSASRNMRAPSS